MSTNRAGSGSRWKETLQTACAVVLLSVFFWLCRPGLSGGGNGGFMAFFGSVTEDSVSCDDHGKWPDETDEERLPSDYPNDLCMPSYVDLTHSIKALRDARNELLTSMQGADAQSTLAAKTRYREALEAVKTGLLKLKTRVPPDAFSDVSAALLGLCGVEDRQDLSAGEPLRLEGDAWQ